MVLLSPSATQHEASSCSTWNCWLVPCHGSVTNHGCVPNTWTCRTGVNAAFPGKPSYPSQV